MSIQTHALSRRSFLLTSGAVGIAVTFGTFDDVLPADAAGVFKPNAWVFINGDDTVTIMSPAVEMGQGTMTALPACLAEDLDADWARVRVETSPDDESIYGNPKFADHMVTVASKATDGYYEKMRLAGAQARKVLLANAARIWKVPVEELSTEPGRVVHTKSGRTISYGALAQTAALPDPMPTVTTADLKPASRCRYIGKDLARVDLPDKVDGKAKYGIDTQLPNMLYASVLHAPVQGEKPEQIDDKAAKAVKDVVAVSPLPHGVAVIGNTLEATQKGKLALKVVWSATAPARRHSSESLAADYGAIARDWAHPSVDMVKEGDPAQAIAKATKVLSAEFVAEHVAHCCMEPLNATALVEGDRVQLWTSNQSVIDMKLAGSIAGGTKPELVKVDRPLVGGGFGRRTDWDVAMEAVMLAKSMPGRPIKVIWSREDDVTQDMWRPLAVQRVEVGLDDKGNILGWRHRVVAASYLARGIPPLFEKLGGRDPVSAVGGEFRYAVPHHQVDYVRTQSGFEVGAWRGVGAGYTKFAVETLIDEIAEVRAVDPLELRRTMLQQHPRAIAVLQAVAGMANWTQKRADGRALGIAYSDALESYTAAVVEASLDQRSGDVRVHQVWAAVDPGTVVQPKIVEAQMEGGIIFGLGAALKEQISLKDGEPQQSNYDSYHVLRMSEIPPIDVKVISTDNPPTGVGEAGVPVIAPAIANALFRLTGKRLRHLPMSPERVKRALA